MSFWSFLSWRRRHWEKTSRQLIREFADRSKEIDDQQFCNWTIAFLFAAATWLEQVFFDDEAKYPNIGERLGSLTKESFRSLYTILLCHHIAISRDGLPNLPSNVHALSTVLQVLASALQQRIDAYNELSDVHVVYHLNREIAQVLGTSENDPIAASYWAKAVLAMANCASQYADNIGDLLDANVRASSEG